MADAKQIVSECLLNTRVVNTSQWSLRDRSALVIRNDEKKRITGTFLCTLAKNERNHLAFVSPQFHTSKAFRSFYKLRANKRNTV